MDNVHVDFPTIMEEEKKKLKFNTVYENAMDKLVESNNVDKALALKLKEKREFGFKKYGELSFQGSFENCMTAPTIEHAKEEVIDLLNYLLHEQYKNMINGCPSALIKELINSTKATYASLCSINHK